MERLMKEVQKSLESWEELGHLEKAVNDIEMEIHAVF